MTESDFNGSADGIIPLAIGTFEGPFKSMGVESAQPQSDGSVDFTLRSSLHGVARLTGNNARCMRVSFFLTSETSQPLAERFVNSLVNPMVGLVQVVLLSSGYAIVRYLCEFDLDSPALINDVFIASTTANAYTQTRAQPEANSALWALADAGISPPPLLTRLGDRVRKIARWQWGTYMYDSSLMDLFSPRLALKFTEYDEDQLLLCHTGHGLNSYYLTLMVSRGPLIAFVQHSWGNTYGHPIRDLERIAATYVRLHVLFDCLETEHEPKRLLLRLSDINHGPPTLTDLDGDLGIMDSTTRRFDGESELFSAAAKILEIEGPAAGGTWGW